ncbi:phenylacetate--CoA ligase family protein [Winogradskyella ursingii]|uniref:phenylacetate--CoA ligase family protein n=1 Tax=Winogradskyella ursingii TaxID=2686079 RepID=UPI0015C8213A|nr:phenylacetate--CoA ligase family protein [Winogradskyella ursingii]
MNLSQTRNQIYWLLDSIKGSKIKEHYQEIEFCSSDPNSDEAKKIRERNLKRLLKHANKTTPYYSKLKYSKNISDYPVIRKTVIQENFEAFQSSNYLDKDNYKVSTSGSTGVPFFLFQNDKKRNRNHADVIFFCNACNYNIGDRLYELEVWREYNQKGKLKAMLQNVVQFDISRLTDERIEELLGLLKNDSQPNKILLGFVSAFELIAKYLENHDIYLQDLNINSVIANSEYLNPYTKETLGKHLNTVVLSRYSSEEIGIIAHQTLNSPNNFVINHASYHVELLNFNNNEPVKPGQFGRIVVTDLFNYAMPIIRYDTGDIAQLGFDDRGAMRFEQIEGRKMDVIYDSKGNLVSSFVVYTKFYKYYKLLKQYQFIQQSEKEYEVKLNIQGDQFDFEEELIADIKSDFGNDANVIITYVDEIPALASGKRRKVVNNMDEG